MNELQDKLRQYINWIGIGLMSIVLIALSLFRVGGGGIELKPLPTSFYGWVIWGILSFAPPFIGVIVLHAFRREGVRQGHQIKEVKAAHDEWLKCVAVDKKTKPMSKEEYYKKHMRKDATSKFTIALLFSIAIPAVIISSDFSNLVALILQLVMFAGMGMFTMFRSIEFCTDQLVVWYAQEVERITNENEEAVKRLKEKEAKEVEEIKEAEAAEPIKTEENKINEAETPKGDQK
jgi:uncharacterized membrane protein YfbV (UPF0208 family)